MVQAEHLGERNISSSDLNAEMRMKVSDIRPAELRRLQEEAYARDLERLRARLPEFVHVPCPSCETDNAAFGFEKYGFSFQRCLRCRTLYMSPRPTPEI